ncbi:MAG: response regulator transcription factor [Methylophilaceae bacterium]|nr:response regulator transcription factor [Methylophilaceae bacterium]
MNDSATSNDFAVNKESATLRPSLLLVDDDDTFRAVLGKVMKRRGFEVSMANSAEVAWQSVQQDPPEYAVIDLKMGGQSGLVLVRQINALNAGTKMVVLTGYASIATAVESIKLGAVHYLAKPVDADDIIAAFDKTEGDAEAAVAANPLSIDRLEWEHIQRILAENDGNISVTARVLNMHRRTLQRKLSKHPSKRPVPQ